MLQEQLAAAAEKEGEVKEINRQKKSAGDERGRARERCARAGEGARAREGVRGAPPPRHIRDLRRKRIPPVRFHSFS